MFVVLKRKKFRETMPLPPSTLHSANTLLRQYTFYGRLREGSVHERRSGRSGRADGGEKEHDTTQKRGIIKRFDLLTRFPFSHSA